MVGLAFCCSPLHLHQISYVCLRKAALGEWDVMSGALARSYREQSSLSQVFHAWVSC